MEQSISNNNQEEPLVSVVIPIYNVEQYLPRCLDSIINQTYRNTEIIVVNDGSTDNCPNIIHDYAKKNNKIKVINKPNGGLESARNAGVKLSTGKYIWHVDSDDYADLFSLEKMVATAIESDCDIVISGYKVYPDDSKPDYYCSLPKFDKTMSGEKALCLMLCTRVGGDVWAKLYKRSLYTQNNIVQKEGHSPCEDYLLNYQLLSVAKTIAQLNYTTINHILRAGSISFQAKEKKHSSLIAFHTGYLFMANYGFPTEDIKNAYYGCVGSDFLKCYSYHDSELLEKLNITKVQDYKKYLYYLSRYSLIKDSDAKLSFKRKYVYAMFKYSLIKNMAAFLLYILSLTFKQEQSNTK